ncbi:hypothetical protein [Propionibacterium cyclohexanicum]|uniref:hypothetical protein n=1 Tax=Propionibacterium cyclohexanicum TaxID=64702 RepID=UPI000B8165B2
MDGVTIRAQDDFYELINADWKNQTEIPPSEQSWGAIDAARRDVKTEIKDILTGPSRVLSPTTVVHRIYDAYLDQARIENDGIRVLADEFTRIQEIRSPFDTHVTGAWPRSRDCRSFFNLEVNLDPLNPHSAILFVGQGGESSWPLMLFRPLADRLQKVDVSIT